MNNVINGKFVEVTVVGETKKEALNKVENYVIMGDATQAFKLWQKKVGANYTEKDLKQFKIDYLAKKGNKPGAGYYITEVPAVENTRQRPYKINNVKNTQGKRKTARVYTLIDANGNVLDKIQGTKKAAEEAIKNMMKKGTLKLGGRCEIERVVTEGEKVAFTWDYVPSKSAKIGKYNVFGLEKI